MDASQAQRPNKLLRVLPESGHQPPGGRLRPQKRNVLVSGQRGDVVALLIVLGAGHEDSNLGVSRVLGHQEGDAR